MKNIELFTILFITFNISLTLLYGSTTVISTSANLNFTNVTTLAVGQSAIFLNGTIRMVNVNTSYQVPNVGNIRELATAPWHATTYVTLLSTYPKNIVLSNIYFKALINNPINVSIYEANTIQEIENITNTSIVGVENISTSNGTITQNIYNTTNQSSLINITTWRQLNNSNTTISPGLNEFRIEGSVIGGVNYQWEYSISTANLITSPIPSNQKTTALLKQKSPPISSINFDPKWDPPTGVENVINLTITTSGNAFPATIPINVVIQPATNITTMTTSNLEIFNTTTGVICPQWDQGNLINPNTIISNVVNTLQYWFLPCAGQIPASTTQTNGYSLGILSLTSTAWSANVGEAPEISTFWGQHDDGANVFTFYSNFSCMGATLPCAYSTNFNTMTTNANEAPFQNNGLSLKGTAGVSSFAWQTKTSYSNNQILDILVNSFTATGGAPGLYFEIANSVNYISATGLYGNGIAWNVHGTTSTNLQLYTASATTATGQGTATVQLIPYFATAYWSSNGLANNAIITQVHGQSQSVIPFLSSTTLSNSKEFFSIGEAGGAQAVNANVLYFLARTAPPSNVMPTWSWGPVQVVSTTTCSFVANVASVNFGTITDGTNTMGTTIPINVVNIGANPSNILLSGSNWNFGLTNPSVSNTVWNNFIANRIWNPEPSIIGTAFASNVEYQLTGTQTDSLNTVTNAVGPSNIIFGVNVPMQLISGSYSQTINVISSC